MASMLWPSPPGSSLAAAGRRIALEFLQGYPCAQVFAPRAAQFICFEPMTAPANALRSGVGLRRAGTGRALPAIFSVSVRGVGNSAMRALSPRV